MVWVGKVIIDHSFMTVSCINSNKSQLMLKDQVKYKQIALIEPCTETSSEGNSCKEGQVGIYKGRSSISGQKEFKIHIR